MSYQIIADQKGKAKAVIVPIKDFKKIQDDLDEYYAIKEYDQSKKENLTFRPLKEVVKSIDQKRSKKH